jgi:hypothetical protein
LHTAVAVEDIATELVTAEILDQWDKVQEILTAEAQAVAEALVEIGSTEQLAVAEALVELDKMLLIQQLTMELEAQDILEDLVLVMVHQVEELVQITAGHHGLV